MTSKPNQVMDELRKGHYHPVYFLQGEEPYFIDLISDYIESHALQEAEKGFNQIIMYGKDSTVGAILTNARRFPMMATRQVVIVKEAQEIIDFGREEGQLLLDSYLKNPLASTILVFCHKHKSLDRRRSVSKSIAEHSVLVDCKKIYDDKIPGWVEEYVNLKKASIDHATAKLLADYIGNNLERLSSEIDKVLLNLPVPARIDTDAVQKYVGISKQYNVFELQKALTVKDNIKAQRIVQYIAANPKLNPIIPVIAVLFAFFSKLLIVHASRSNSQQSLAKELKVPPFFMREYIVAKDNYSKEKVINNIGHLRKADMMTKGVGSQQTPPGEILRELIFKLMH